MEYTLQEIVLGTNTAILTTLRLEDSFVSPRDSIIADLGADSLDTSEMVIAVEDAFGLDISDDEAEVCQTVQDVYDLVERMLKVQGRFKATEPVTNETTNTTPVDTPVTVDWPFPAFSAQKVASGSEVEEDDGEEDEDEDGGEFVDSEYEEEEGFPIEGIEARDSKQDE